MFDLAAACLGSGIARTGASWAKPQPVQPSRPAAGSTTIALIEHPAQPARLMDSGFGEFKSALSQMMLVGSAEGSPVMRQWWCLAETKIASDAVQQ